MGRRLKLTTRTVESHASRIVTKLGLRTDLITRRRSRTSAAPAR
ncbi:MAG: hypothetical protein ACRDZ8_04605 [Acidimicrobiales bacterium]